MPHRGTESDFELTTIERLIALGYQHVHGSELSRVPEEVVLRDRLRASLEARYPEAPSAVLDEAVRTFGRPEGVDTLRRNMAFHEALTRGIELPYDRDDGVKDHAHIYAVDWDHPETNEFLVVNQLSVSGKNDRRPDIVIYVNGLPLVVFELKNPWDEDATAEGAHNQIGHYTVDIPQLFEFNAIAVASDGVTTQHGVWTAPWEWFAPWKSIDGYQVEANTTGSMKTLIEGLFPPEHLLSFIRHFVVFEVASDVITKKGAKYHQFFAARLAAQKAIEAVQSGDDRRIGVVWHTTGSGKSLSMAFLVGLLRRALENPTFVIEVDRTDLDDQLHDQFVAARSLVGAVEHADSVEELRALLQTEGGEVVFTTIEKFRLREGDVEHPVLSERSDVIVIADEAHRSQYGFLQGYARYLRDALPNARFLGFTGTPVSFASAHTVEVFGDYIHTYDIRQSQEDGATVPIYYEPRQIRLALNPTDLDGALEEIAKGYEPDELERRKSRWAAVAQAAGASDRMAELASDLVAHFTERTSTLAGKALAVCMTRTNCVRLYDALTAIPGCPEVRVVMTGNLAEDPKEWSEAGHITTKRQRDAIKKRMIDADDPLKIVIVCDMWLTGTDIPCLHTLYIDKPMQGHSLIQAISRVNRVFEDKPHGLIVDYIGIGDELREATSTYTDGGGRGEPAPDITEDAVPLFLAALHQIRSLLPEDTDYGDWRQLSRVALEDRYAAIYGHLTDDDELRDDFLLAESNVSRAFLLVKHLDECRPYADELIFYQRTRKQLLKTIPGRRTHEIERAVRDLVDDAVASQGVVDIFAVAGIERPDISILDDAFLQTFKNQPLENLRLKLLEQLMKGELQKRERRNLAKTSSFRALLEDTLRRYHNRLIDAAAVIQAMIQIHNEMENDDRRAAELGLEEDELAFYDAVAENLEGIYDTPFLRDLIHEVVQRIKRNLKVDWTEPHRDDVKAAVRAAVRNVLRQKNVQAADLEALVGKIMEQAEALYRDWPLAA